MKKRFLGFALLAGAGVAGYVKREFLKAVLNIEKPMGDIFTTIDGDDISFLCKNESQSEDMFLEWVLANGWEKADQVGEGLFFINEEQETLLLNRESILNGRYLLWRASRPVEA